MIVADRSPKSKRKAGSLVNLKRGEATRPTAPTRGWPISCC